MSRTRDLEEASGSYRRRTEPLSVLVVDDDEVDRELVRRLLAKAEIAANVTEANEPMAALALIRRAAFDVIFLDYNFPRHDGLFVLREIREQGTQTPVILLTGQDDTALAVELMRAGATDYIAKSALTAQRLSASVRNAQRLRMSEVATRAVQEALRGSDELVRAMLEASRDAIEVLDLEGRLLTVNGVALRELDAIDPAQARGQPWLDLWEDRSAAATALAEARSGRSARFLGERRRDAKRFEVSLAPVKGADGKPERLLVLSREV